DRRADRDAYYRRVGNRGLLEPGRGPAIEVLRRVGGVGNLRPAVPRIVKRVDREATRQVRDQLLEQIELRSPRMQPNSVRPASCTDRAHLRIAKVDVTHGDLRSPGEPMRLRRRAPQCLDQERGSDEGDGAPRDDDPPDGHAALAP